MNFMRELLVLFICLFVGVQSALAYELVLPKEKKSTVNTNYAFFVGKAKKNETITINDEKIYVASNGAFAHSVKLKDGENRIVVRSNLSAQIYRFSKEKTPKAQNAELIEFKPKLFLVNNDNTPLRNSPIDQGMNRISHLYKDTNIVINGEKGDFYRVLLSKDKEAWIAKTAVKENDTCPDTPKFLSMSSKAFKNASMHIIEFNNKLPYTIDDSGKEIVFKVYNPQQSDNTVYTVNIRKPDKYYYKVNLCNGTYQVKVNELTKPANCTLEGLTITVDAGHGGSEKGAEGCLGDKEKDINLAIASELKEILTLMGANVIMTRECDANVSLDNRVKLAQDNFSNIFVSIHLNSIPDIPINIHKNRGTSVYYYNDNSKALAKSVYENITNTLKTRKDGIRTASFAVIRPTDYIGILLEIAYITNPLDSLVYKDENFARETAKSIANGILEYVKTEE